MRLIDSNKKVSFKNWIKQHDPKFQWNWNDPRVLSEQLINVIRESGDIDLKSLFIIMFDDKDRSLNSKQNYRFLKEKY